MTLLESRRRSCRMTFTSGFSERSVRSADSVFGLPTESFVCRICRCGFEEAAGNEDGAGDVALGPLVGLAHVDHDRLSGAGARVGGRDLADLRADAADHLLERGHALLQPRKRA